MIKTQYPQIPLAMVIRAVDESGEELQLCSKQKKDHVCVIKTLNTELFIGGGKADVTFYCKGSNGGGCKTKRPSKVKLQALLRYEDGVKLSYGSTQFLVRGNRRQAGTKPIRYKPEIEDDVVATIKFNPHPSASGKGGNMPGIYLGTPGMIPITAGGFITKISPTTSALYSPSTYPGRHYSCSAEPATVPAPSFAFYPSFPIYPIITPDRDKKFPSKESNSSPPSRKRSIDITTPPPLDTAKRMSIGNLLNPNGDSQ